MKPGNEEGSNAGDEAVVTEDIIHEALEHFLPAWPKPSDTDVQQWAVASIAIPEPVRVALRAEVASRKLRRKLKSAVEKYGTSVLWFMDRDKLTEPRHAPQVVTALKKGPLDSFKLAAQIQELSDEYRDYTKVLDDADNRATSAGAAPLGGK